MTCTLLDYVDFSFNYMQECGNLNQFCVFLFQKPGIKEIDLNFTLFNQGNRNILLQSL